MDSVPPPASSPDLAGRTATAQLPPGSLAFLEALLAEYRSRPDSLTEAWQRFFEALDNEPTALPAANGTLPRSPLSTARAESSARLPLSAPPPGMTLQSRVFQLINNYRVLGHTHAKLDPLDAPHMIDAPDLSLAFFGLDQIPLEQEFSRGTLYPKETEASLAEILAQLKETYCSSVGAEYMLLRDHEQRLWLQEHMERTRNHPPLAKSEKLYIYQNLAQAELFERFLHVKFVGQKRFSLEGGESLVVMLNALLESAAAGGAEEVVIGMSHRGRLNTLANVMGKPHETIFAEFLDSWDRAGFDASGDVKYHIGYSSDVQTRAGDHLHLSLSFNPSHLEAIYPVMLGSVRAKQRRDSDDARKRVIPLIIHGDAAVIGQGIVAETLNLARLGGYTCGGTIHVIVNNQIGFTACPHEYRSSVYSSDIAKMINVPVLHVNADHPEAVHHVIKLALAFRQRFGSDIVIDLICYRRHGHNESDDPSFTQPSMYQKIKKHPTTLALYQERLLTSGAATQAELEAIRETHSDKMKAAHEKTTQGGVKSRIETLSGAWEHIAAKSSPDQTVMTEIDAAHIARLTQTITHLPESFTPHPLIKRLLKRRDAMGRGELPIDWGMGELLAYGSLLIDGFNVRISGQDSCRGTFSHRHASMIDFKNGADYTPLQHLSENGGNFSIFNSPLSEAGVLGFEFGYSLSAPDSLVVWEAQFGDFSNGAQVIIDQFINSSAEKWVRFSGIVLLLPHGFEGQGPEHSSARPERFLSACGNENIQVCVPTTPAQCFHLLRRQLHSRVRKPLVIMSPKSLLRHPLATSSVDDLVKGRFRRVLFDHIVPEKQATVERLVFCSGKVYYDLRAAREKAQAYHVALVRVEQLYPFPEKDLRAVLDQHAAGIELIWCQEEPRNMGAWVAFREWFEGAGIGKNHPPLRYTGRHAAGSPATGSYKKHLEEQTSLVQEALGLPLP